MAIGSTVIFAFLLINLPEAILGKKDSPYEFTNRSYYEQYGEQFEQDNGFEYFESETVNGEQQTQKRTDRKLGYWVLVCYLHPLTQNAPPNNKGGALYQN